MLASREFTREPSVCWEDRGAQKLGHVHMYRGLKLLLPRCMSSSRCSRLATGLSFSLPLRSHSQRSRASDLLTNAEPTCRL
jgi:hypothetical protein